MTTPTQREPIPMVHLFLVIVAANIASCAVLAASAVIYLDAQRNTVSSHTSSSFRDVARGM